MTGKHSIEETIGRVSVDPGSIQENSVSIRTELRPGDLGAIISLHGLVYETEFGFGAGFEPFVAKTVAEFGMENNGKGRFWLAEPSGALIGCTAIVDRDDGASSAGQLRWVVVHPAARGLGLGKKLMGHALAYCQEQRHARIFLHTTEGLDASQRLYKMLGFSTLSEYEDNLWGQRRLVITMEMVL
jgi:N-acetylglutamate synthase-like GNAT family acetyltransferase